MLIYFDVADWRIGLGILAVALFLLRRGGRGSGYLLFFAIFWVYMLVVISIVVFPIAINTNYSQPAPAPDINLIPFFISRYSIVQTGFIDIFGNIALTVPFGFAINFLRTIRQRTMWWAAFALGTTFELIQLALSVAFRSAFRTVDINDVLLNAVGVMLGYGLFRGFAWAYVKVLKWEAIKGQWLLAYVYEVARQARETSQPQDAQGAH